MRFVFIVLILGVLVFAPQFAFAAIALPPPSPTNPENGAPAIFVPLVLDWEDVLEAQSYRYELIGYGQWLQERTQQERDAWVQEWTDQGIQQRMEDGAKNGFLVTQSQSNPFDSSIVKFLEPQHPSSWYQDECSRQKGDTCNDVEIQGVIANQQTHEWRVRSCEQADGTLCGSFNTPTWTFTYLLSPATLVSPADRQNNLPLPITLEWEPVVGAQSYELVTLPCPPWKEEDDDCHALPIFKNEEGELPTTYTDPDCLFNRSSEYTWGIGACFDENAALCSGLQELSRSSRYLYTSVSAPALQAAQLKAPLIDANPPLDPTQSTLVPGVSKDTELVWDGHACAYFNQINIYQEDGTPVHENSFDCTRTEDICTKGQEEIGQETLSLGDSRVAQHLWDEPGDLDKLYSWGVTPCWTSVLPSVVPTPDCTNTTETSANQRWWFRTTGAPPVLKFPGNGTDTKIPLQLSWKEVPGAASYVYELSSALGAKTGAIQTTQAEIPYEQGLVEPEQNYSWKVKTCIDEKGNVCGQWSEERMFRTYPLLASIDPEPADKAEFSLPGTLRWRPDDGANYYQYQVRYTSLKYGVDEDENDILETRPSCTSKVGNTVIPQPGGISPITSQPSFYLSEYCRGEYEWLVRSCADKDCSVAAPSVPLWKFTAIKQTSEEQTGLCLLYTSPSPRD